MTYFGTNIKKIRQIKGLSQQAFAELLDLNRGVISSYEEGRAEPKIDSLLRIAKILNLTTDDLLTKPLTINKITNFSEIEHLIPNSEKKQEQVYELDDLKGHTEIDLQKILANVDFVYKVSENLLQHFYPAGTYLFLTKKIQNKDENNALYLVFDKNSLEITDSYKGEKEAYKIIGSVQGDNEVSMFQSIVKRIEKLELELEEIKKGKK